MIQMRKPNFSMKFDISVENNVCDLKFWVVMETILSTTYFIHITSVNHNFCVLNETLISWLQKCIVSSFQVLPVLK